MKKIITICFLALVMIAGGISTDAKTTKKKSAAKATSSVRVDMDDYGDPIILGHTYRVTMDGNRYDFSFGYGNVDVIMSNSRYMESYGFPWEYDGSNVYIYDSGVPTPMFQGVVSRDGKSIKLNSGYTLRIIR